MLYTYTNTNQTVATGANIAFNTIGVQTGNTATHPSPTTVNLNKCGFYEVTFNADATVTGTTAGNISVQLQGNGVNIVSAEATETSTSTTAVANLSFTTLIQVKPNCCAVTNIPLVLTYVNTGVPAIFSNVATTITKLC